MNGDKARILVVDDDEAARYTVTRALRAEGHEILEAATGEAALSLALTVHPDLVVLDVHLPDMLGFDVAERLRAEASTQAVAVLMVSASFIGADAQALGLRRGADAYLTHPIEPQVLAATAQALLRMRSAEQRARDALAERERLLAEARDATAQRERLLTELRDEARRKNEFLAVLSHELRNPLAPIRNGIRILETAAPGSDLAQRARETIDRQARQLTRLVDDLLDVTRIERGKVRLQREHLDLGALVRRAVDDHRDLFAKAGVELVARTPPATLDVDGDPARISQVIGNLLQNAAKFTPRGGQVWVSVEREVDDLQRGVLRVRDTGVGITPETLLHLFQPFVQGDKTLDRSSGGLGLGLALAKGIVELHGGRITATSGGPGQGAELTVTLPLIEARVRPAAPEPPRRIARSPRRVLIIEDLRDAAESLRDVLRLGSHIVEIAQDGARGIALARSFTPDIVLCDIGLPLVDGYEVARRMRQDPALKGIFLVALSGYAQQEDVARSTAAGFDRHLAKPARLEELERILADAP